jgi:hypothetical protein
VIVGIAQPDYRITGGFELLLGELVTRLRRRGMRIRWLTVDVGRVRAEGGAVALPAEVRAAAPDFFGYMDLLDAFRRLDTQGCDVVLTTSPPSFAVDHERRVALFYHHQRIYYDLADLYVDAGFAEAPTHRILTRAVRKVDAGHLAGIHTFFAGSRSVAGRLDHYNGRTERVEVFSAPPIHPAPGAVEPTFTAGPLCVGRLEFPKRTELFVAAMKLLPSTTGTVVGDGGRLGWTIRLDRDLSATDPARVAGMQADRLWKQPHTYLPDVVANDRSNVVFERRVGPARLSRLYQDALCLVAPAYDEDYGLTALEAMTYGLPVVVCEDGGGLAEIVEHEVTGLVVPPTPAAIAEAIRRLDSDRAAAAAMGAAGRERAAGYTWSDATARLEGALLEAAS